MPQIALSNFADFAAMSEDDKILSMAIYVAQSETSDISTKNLLATIKNKPLRRWRVLRQLRAELESEGLLVSGQAINWEAIGDFFVKIAPIIFEIIKMFL